ncbi:hypothetical protein COW46_00650 [Candidatus Gracilibacteria bacterium CG17_big_fil_post_rev_8_21_14_2_50_48_13]|nr:MAG: hypothetical protein COW46_00650 [Candidatus Gracilibacteria bacterium CG17_big_fil_post_rev_8_21_14_2_50_48_13]
MEHINDDNQEENIEQEELLENLEITTPLEFPHVTPRDELFSYFHELLQTTVEQKSLSEMLFLQFQKELMLRRVPDPIGVSWVNALEVTGDLPENDMLYARYIVRKWLACIPPFFHTLSCLERIHITSFPRSRGVFAFCDVSLPSKIFTSPKDTLMALLEAYVQTIPFFEEANHDLRSATWLVEGCVFSFDEWWQALKRGCKSNKDQYKNKSYQQIIAECLKVYLDDPLGTTEKDAHPAGALVELLAHAQINGYLG